jgi:hypothetical protein
MWGIRLAILKRMRTGNISNLGRVAGALQHIRAAGLAAPRQQLEALLEWAEQKP